MAYADSESLTAIEEKIAGDKLTKFKGAAQIRIKHLDFPYPSRPVDERIISQLKRDFDGEGCLRKEATNRIPALIEDSVFDAALQRLGMSAEVFKALSNEPPILRLQNDIVLECLHGQHRILAAKQHLVPLQRWWIIDLYSTKLNADTKQAFREGYSYSSKYKSGEIFRFIRLCFFDNDIRGVQRWRSRLSESQDQHLSMLLKRKMLIEALDTVLHIQGLWRSFYLGSLDVFLGLKCDEEIICYIDFIKKIWTRILNNETLLLMNTDPSTVEFLQSKAPALSKIDSSLVQHEMEFGQLFPGITDQGKRDLIKQSLLATIELIPTLYTLIRDVRYLKQAVPILTTILPKSRNQKTLRQRFHFIFTGMESDNETMSIQDSVTTFISVSTSNLDSFNVSYQQLWLCSYRVCKYPNEYSRLQIATLAHRLGFSSTEIDNELRRDAAQAVIESAAKCIFNILRPNEIFNFDPSGAQVAVTAFKRYVATFSVDNINTVTPTIAISGIGEPSSRRSGYGSQDTSDLNQMFLARIHMTLSEYQKSGDEISSFYVKRSRHIAFFGGLQITGDRVESRVAEPPTAAPTRGRLVEISTPPIFSFTTRQNNNDASGITLQDEQQSTSGAMAVVLFKEAGCVIEQVLYQEQIVNNQARIFAEQGKKLHLANGAHFIWQECFNILKSQEDRTVHVYSVGAAATKKRRRLRGSFSPHGVPPALTRVFDSVMDTLADEQL